MPAVASHGFVSIPFLFTVVVFAFLVKLGLWQLDRAGAKRVRIEQIAERAEWAPLDATILASDNLDKYLLDSPIRMAGAYRADKTILLDNRTWQGRAGYQALVPLEVAPELPWVLVNLGWLPQGIDRRQWPSIDLPAGQQVIEGRLHQPQPLIRLGDDEPPRANGWRVQAVETEQLAAWLNHPVYPLVVLLAPGLEPVLPRDWQLPGLPPQRHVGYAVQWFSLAGAWLVLCGVFWWRQRTTRKSE